jgi:hypothetical protein
MRRRFRPGPPAAPLVAAVLALTLPRSPARAESSLTYKYEDYAEAGGRIDVHAQSGLVQQELGPDWQLKLSGVVDAIAGATPTGVPAPAGSTQVPVSELHDHRKAWEADVTRSFERVSLTAGFGESREHDYISRGWSLNTATEFNGKNTTVLAGVAGHSDNVEAFFTPAHPYLGKQATDLLLGVTQLLDPLTSVGVNLSWGRDTGFLNDQYKVVRKTVAILPGLFIPLTFAESRPGERNQGAVLASVDRAFPGWRGSVEASYRYYRDTFGIAAQTVELQWFQKLGERFVLRPDLRLYEQSAANFYFYNLDLAAPGLTPTAVPNSRGPAYSSDYRLSEMATVTYGLKAIWTPTDRIELDLAYDRYEMWGRDGVTPKSAYPIAGIITAGFKFSW